MNSATYLVWNKIKSLAADGKNTYHCSDTEDIRRINELINAGYITVSWRTSLDAVFYINGEVK